MAQPDRLLLFSEHPVRVTSINASSGVIENVVTVDSGRNTRIPTLPRALVDGRLLLSLGTSERSREIVWEHSYLVYLLDPALPGKSAILWRYRPPRDDESRYPRQVQVIGRNVVILDESRGAAVVDLRDGSQVQWSPRLPVDEVIDREPNLARTQPHQSTTLNVLTSALGNVPPKLSAYELPDLTRRYSVEVADDAREEVNVVDSEGHIGITLRPRDPAGSAARIRVFEPNQARLVQEITLPGGGMPYFVARVQNGVLILTTPSRDVLGYAPRDRK